MLLLGETSSATNGERLSHGFGSRCSLPHLRRRTLVLRTRAAAGVAPAAAGLIEAGADAARFWLALLSPRPLTPGVVSVALEFLARHPRSCARSDLRATAVLRAATVGNSPPLRTLLSWAIFSSSLASSSFTSSLFFLPAKKSLRRLCDDSQGAVVGRTRPPASSVERPKADAPRAGLLLNKRGDGSSGADVFCCFHCSIGKRRSCALFGFVA